MSQPLLALRIFIASPGGLNSERQRFRDLVYKFNEDLAHRNGVTFVPVGWETHPGGMGRGQAQINEEVRTCDYLLLVLHNRWGFAPHRSRSDGSYDPDLPTSGTEEEYRVARECHADPDRPMRDIAIRFKQVDPVQMSDPGEQLQKVLNFRRELEEGKEVLFKEYDTLEKFSDDVHSLLSHWLATYDRNVATVTPPEPAAADFTLPDVGDRPDANDLVDKAQAALDQGNLLDAELLLADALALGENRRVFTAYALLQTHKGQLDTAIYYYEKALVLSRDLGDSEGVSESFLGMGISYAEKIHASYMAIGNLICAVDIDHSLIDKPEWNYAFGLAFANKGENEVAIKYLMESSRMYFESLQYEKGAKSYIKIGAIYRNIREFEKSEHFFREALNIYRRMKYYKEMNFVYRSLCALIYSKGNLEDCLAVMREKSEINERLGDIEEMAENHYDLGILFKSRGDLHEARRYWTQAVDLYARIPMPHRVAKVQGRLDELETLGGEEEA